MNAHTLNGQALNGRLDPAHLRDLRASGLTDATIAACGFRSIEAPAAVNKALGWERYDGALGPCLRIPFTDADGRRTGYCRLKPARPRKDKDGNRVRYESPKGMPNQPFFPPGTLAALKDAKVPLLVTEGEKKAAKADQEGFPCIGLVGVYGWQKKRVRDADGKPVGERELIDGLVSIPWQGRKVYIVFDSDAANNLSVSAAERRLAEAIAKRGANVEVVRLAPAASGAKAGLDDFLIFHGPAGLRALLAEAAKPVAPAPALPLPSEVPWPAPLADDAFHGLPGKIVRAIAPSTEADPAALLVQVLVAFGSAAGRAAHFRVESDSHFPNEFAVLVGRTAKARKGTSWGRVATLFEAADASWFNDRVVSGVSSGEGIVWAVRDAIAKRERVKEGGTVRYEDVEADAGVEDKRLLIHEAEFANVLKQLERQGNTASVVLRQAWDGNKLRTLTKNTPAVATGAHVAMIGHITDAELRRYLTATETANGFGNRILFVCADRSKVLPEGGHVDGRELQALQRELSKALEFAKGAGEFRRDEAARAIWREIYGTLSEGRPGLAGSMTARAEAHVMRLALLYAAMDRATEIQAPHLLAGMALWDYCERSVRYIFGDSLGDARADEIVRLLRASPEGMTRTDLYNFFGRNLSSERIGRALATLLQAKLARRVEEKTEGRPVERWFAQ